MTNFPFIELFIIIYYITILSINISNNYEIHHFYLLGYNIYFIYFMFQYLIAYLLAYIL